MLAKEENIVVGEKGTYHSILLASSGRSGVQRWVKFVKYLRNFGIEPIVYVPENPTYPLVDTNIGQDLPGDITVLKKPIKEPYKLASLFFKKKTKSMSAGMVPRHKATFLEKCLLWVRGNLFIPDARIAWGISFGSFFKELYDSSYYRYFNYYWASPQYASYRTST